jgi:carbonic anhydrase
MTDNLLSCNETPLKFPQLFDVQRIYPCVSCKLRLNAQVAGPGNVTRHESGLLLNENPQTTLSINGIQYNLLESFIYTPGAHRFPGQEDTYPMEIALYFRDETGQKTVCLCIPVQVGAANSYFTSLNQVSRNRPTIGSLVSPTSSIISYRGADLRGRNGRNSRPRPLCDPIARIVTFYVVMTPASIAASDYQRLTRIANGVAGPPKPMTEIIESRYKLLTRIDGITIIDNPLGAGGSGTDRGVSTKALKCYRLDTEKDVVNDKVYIGGGGPGSTLDQELAGRLAAEADAIDVGDTSVQPGDIEKWIGIIIGSVIAILIVAFLIYLVWSGSFRNYAKVQRMYDTPVSKTFGEVKLWKGWSLPSFLCPKPATPVAK